MGLNDLHQQLSSSTETNVFQSDDFEYHVVPLVVNAVKDSNGEVQNMAVKTLGLLVKSVRENQLQRIVENLCEFMTMRASGNADTSSLHDIAALSLKTVITNLPPQVGISQNVIRKLVPRILSLEVCP